MTASNSRTSNSRTRFISVVTLTVLTFSALAIGRVHGSNRESTAGNTLSSTPRRSTKAAPPLAVEKNVTDPPDSAQLAVYIDRKHKKLYLTDTRNRILLMRDIGIGRGGLKKKTNMADEVTPTGSFKVDIILSPDPANNKISQRYLEKYGAEKNLLSRVDSPQHLSELFKTMSLMDFDRDGKPDKAYGTAYIGLSSTNAITGPKLRKGMGTIYWYSIALHGTPTPANLGKANSGGCVHVDKVTLEHLVKRLKIGSPVVITDKAPGEAE